MDTIVKILQGYTHINDLFKRDIERKQEEIFFKDLGRYTTIKLSK